MQKILRVLLSWVRTHPTNLICLVSTPLIRACRKNKRNCHYCCSNFSKTIFACLGNAVVSKVGIEYKRFYVVNVMVKNIRKTRKITTRPTGVDSAASARPVWCWPLISWLSKLNVSCSCPMNQLWQLAAKPVHPFLSRVSILTRDINIANLSVRPSVRYVPVSDEPLVTICNKTGSSVFF